MYLDQLHSGLDRGPDGPWLDVLKPAMMPGLLKGLSDPDVRVRTATVKALSSLAKRWSETEANEQADGQKPTPAQAEAWAHQHRVNVLTTQALLSSLEDTDDRIRWIGAETLGMLGADANTAVPALIRMVKTEKRRIPPDESIGIRSFDGKGQRYRVGTNKKGAIPCGSPPFRLWEASAARPPKRFRSWFGHSATRQLPSAGSLPRRWGGSARTQEPLSRHSSSRCDPELRPPAPRTRNTVPWKRALSG